MTIDILGIGQKSKNFFQLFSFHGLTVCLAGLQVTFPRLAQWGILEN
jgi:hypothetical protein